MDTSFGNDVNLKNSYEVPGNGMFFRCRLDEQNTAEFISNGSSELCQYTPEDFTLHQSITLFELIHPEDRAELKIKRSEQLKSGKVCRNQFRIVTASGAIKVVEEVSNGLFENGKPMYLEGYLSELSPLKTATVDLEKRTLDYGNILENISDGLIIDNIEGKVVFANDQFLNLIGIERKELDSFVFDDYVAPEYKDIIRQRHIQRMKGEEVSSVFEYVGVRKDGSRRWFEARVTKIIYGDKIIGTQSAIRDITLTKAGIDLLKASEAEKTNLLKELNQRYNELMQFNYIVSHNLRAPIANIIGLAEMYEMVGSDAEEKDQIVRHIESSILKIDELISDLNIILAARSDINSKLEKVSFSEVIESVERTLENQILDTSTKITVKIEEGADELYSIKSFIKSIFYNLINNAIKYRSVEVNPHIDIHISKKDTQVEITVQDNGIGIDMKRHGKEIFGLYKRFHPTFEGKGLGLNMTKTQIEALGGSISLQSSPKKGSLFTILLPDNTSKMHSHSADTHD